MRTDKNATFRIGDVFIDDQERNVWLQSRALATITHSFSGNERNRLFLNGRGRKFLDISGVSGLDSPSDGRVFVLWDYDRDGRQDIAVVNTNPPFLNFYHNEIPIRRSEGGSVATAEDRPDSADRFDVRRLSNADSEIGRFVALRFVGGNHSAQPSRKQSSRDGYGVKVRVSAGDLKLWREHGCGQGLAAQNSATMLVGIGPNRYAERIEIEWPSGNKQHRSQVPAGSLVTVYENADHSPNGSGFEISPYRPRAPVNPARKVALKPQPAFRFVLPESIVNHSPDDSPDSPKLRLYTTMATWCAACRAHAPRLHFLASAFEPGTLHMVGIPIDENDRPQDLKAYAERHRPAYRLLTNPTAAERLAVTRIVRETLQTEALPATIVTDASGRVLLTVAGVPSVSQLRKLLRK